MKGMSVAFNHFNCLFIYFIWIHTYPIIILISLECWSKMHERNIQPHSNWFALNTCLWIIWYFISIFKINRNFFPGWEITFDNENKNKNTNEFRFHIKVINDNFYLFFLKYVIVVFFWRKYNKSNDEKKDTLMLIQYKVYRIHQTVDFLWFDLIFVSKRKTNKFLYFICFCFLNPSYFL